MSTARLVPVTREMNGEELDAEDAWHIARRVGLRRLAVDTFVRFRYGDGFSSSRALALQTALAVVPFLLALTGLTADIDQQRPADVLARTVSALSPGHGDADALSEALSSSRSGDDVGELALTFGLLFALISMTTAMAQIERGMNRIYGIERDRPAVPKYARAAVLTAILAVPVGLGFLLLVAGDTFAQAMRAEYGWSDGAVDAFTTGRWILGLLMLVTAISVVLDHAPRRRQPGLSWLALGAGLTVAMTLVATGLLALYVDQGSSFGEVYGPLAGVFALLIWGLLTSVALFLGAAVCAQLEAYRSGDPGPADEDPGQPHAVHGGTR